MGFDNLDREAQTQLARQLAEMMNAEDPSQYDAGDLDELFSQFDTHSWIRVPSPPANGLSAADIFSQDLANGGPETEPTARETFTALVTRRRAGEELGASEMFLLHSLAEGYGVQVGENGLTDTQLELLETRLLAGDSAIDISAAFSTARAEAAAAAEQAAALAAQNAAAEQLAAAQAAAEQAAAELAAAEAELDAAQGILQVQAEMAAMGLISPDEITGVWNPDHTDAFLEGTYTDVANGNRYNVAAIERIAEAKGFEGTGADAFDQVRAQVLSTLSESLTANENGDYDIHPEAATDIMGIMMEGRDFTHIFEAALAGDENSIRMMQAITDQRIDGQLEAEDMAAAMSYLRENHPGETALIDQFRDTRLETIGMEPLEPGSAAEIVASGASMPAYLTDFDDPQTQGFYDALDIRILEDPALRAELPNDLLRLVSIKRQIEGRLERLEQIENGEGGGNPIPIKGEVATLNQRFEERLAELDPETRAEYEAILAGIEITEPEPEPVVAPDEALVAEAEVEPEPVITADASLTGATLPVVGAMDLENLGLDEEVIATIDPTELSLAALSYRIMGMDRFEQIDLESVSLRDIMEFERMGVNWQDAIYGSEYAVGDRTMIDIVRENGASLELAAARAGIDPDAPLNLEDPADLAKMTEAIVYATHGETIAPFSQEQLGNGAYVALEGELPEVEAPDTVDPELLVSDARAMFDRGTGLNGNEIVIPAGSEESMLADGAYHVAAAGIERTPEVLTPGTTFTPNSPALA